MAWKASYPLCADAIVGSQCIVEEEQGTLFYPEYRECSTSALLFPGFNLLPNSVLAVIYGLALAWCFFGVAIISDIFMSSIEQITSAEKTVTRKDANGNERTIQVLLWNPTVANLTLMALGSSAPEIMLAVVETLLTLGEVPGELGPSTIVGSAAFNLLVIAAVCIMSVPEGETKSVTDFGVFAFTAIFSLWAYLWMLIVYVIWTPDQVTIIEAVLTLAYLPLMVLCAYKINTRAGGSGGADEPAGGRKEDEEGYQRIVGANVDLPDGNQMHIKGEEIEHVVNQMMEISNDLVCMPALDRKRTVSLSTADVIKHIEGLDTDDVSAMKQAAWDIAQQAQSPMTSIQYKINARKAMTGKTYVGANTPLHPTNSIVPESAGVAHDAVAIVSFGASAYTGTEHNGHIRLQVTCAREPKFEKSVVRVAYATRDGELIGTEKELANETTSGELLFAPDEVTKFIYVHPFQDDNMEYEIGDGFFVDLQAVPGCDIRLLRSTANVLIEGATFPGRLMFHESSLEVNHNGSWAYIPVVRKHGCDGDVSIDYSTVDGTAKAGVHYEQTTGTLKFSMGEKQKDIQIQLKEGEVDTSFQLVLSNPQNTSINVKRSTCDVHLTADAKFGLVMRMVQSIIRRKNDAVTSRSTWLAQFKEAIIPGGAINADNGESELEISDYILHYVSFTWKVLFATVPPPEFMSGGPCFVVSVLYIGGITYIVGEFATLFGCAVGLPDAVTAYSFVALGTSLPDTFASRQAATEAPDADAAIGNVTGSNSVNVFLGLGLPWLIASLYYAARGEDYVTPRGALAFSVTVFMCCSSVCLLMLVSKRFMGGELGGSGFTRTGFAVIMVGLWLLYLVLSGMQAVGDIEGF